MGPWFRRDDGGGFVVAGEAISSTVVPAKHLRAPGPIRRALTFWHAVSCLPLSLRPVVTGPCFRRDDGGGFTSGRGDGISARSSPSRPGVTVPVTDAC